MNNIYPHLGNPKLGVKLLAQLNNTNLVRESRLNDNNYNILASRVPTIYSLMRILIFAAYLVV